MNEKLWEKEYQAQLIEIVIELELQIFHSFRFFLYGNVEINYDRYFENVICWLSSEKNK